MRDLDIGKRMNEEAILDQILDSLPLITGREITEEWEGEAEQVEGSPDFIVGFDGLPFGIELAEIRGYDDAWDYISEAYRIASKKSESYSRRGMFRYPIALVLYSTTPPLLDVCDELTDILVQEDFEGLGFSEIWATDFSSEYYSLGHPLRRADMFCFKPAALAGFHRIGSDGRKPFG